MRRLLSTAGTMDAEKMNKLATFISIAAQTTKGPKIDPLDELEKDEDVQIAIADVEQLKKREEIIRKKTRLQRFRDTLVEWGRFTSYDGISHLVLAANNWIRLFWSILVFISLAAFFYLLFITLKTYLAYGTDVNLNFKYEQYHFPTITICNSSPYKLSLVKHNPGMKLLLKIYNRLLAEGKI